MQWRLALLASLFGAAACTVPDIGVLDAATHDAAADARAGDLGASDSGAVDAASIDLGVATDAADDGSADAGATDAGPTDAGAGDAGVPDLGCVGGPTEATYYLDCDRDNYGGSVTMLSCGPPSSRPMCSGGGSMLGNWVTMPGDCDDGVRQAHPGQLAYFTSPRSSAGVGLSYDYDCDGVETPEYTSVAALGCAGVPPTGTTCDSLSSWEGTVPACGATGTIRPCVASGLGFCTSGTSTSRVQPCR